MSESNYSELRLPLSERLPIVTYTNLFCPEAETVWMSPQVERLTGYRLDEWVDNPGFFSTVLHPDDRAAVLEEVRASRDELRPFSRDYRLVARDGGLVWIHDESVPILDEDGRPELIQGYFIDITARKALEQQLLHAQKTEALGRLAGEIAHDFNNHLMAIQGNADLLAGAVPADGPARKYLTQITQTIERAARLTRQLLAFGRKQALEPRRISVDRIVLELEPMLSRVAGDSTSVILELRETEPVYADAGQIEQVVVNLVANARDAMPTGGVVSIRTHPSTVTPGAESERLGLPAGDYTALVVADNGEGMDEDTQMRALEPFFTTKDRDRGTGLGLSIVDSIVREGGGAISLQSAPGHGTRFRILLPVAAVG